MMRYFNKLYNTPHHLGIWNKIELLLVSACGCTFKFDCFWCHISFYFNYMIKQNLISVVFKILVDNNNNNNNNTCNDNNNNNC